MVPISRNEYAITVSNIMCRSINNDFQVYKIGNIMLDAFLNF